MNRIAILTLTALLAACGTPDGPDSAITAPTTNPEPVVEPVDSVIVPPSDPQSPDRPRDQDEPVSPTDPSPTTPPVAHESLTASQILVRASIDVRGRHPSADELAAVKADPSQLDVLIDQFLDDEAFADSVADLFARTLRSRTENYLGIPSEEETSLAYQVAVSEEPLMLIRHIVSQNKSYDEFLTADYTFVEEEMARRWPITGYDEARGGWQKVRYADDRPAAGYISQGSTYMRYLSDDFNYNRGRANALTRILVCDDFLKRPVDFPRDIDLSDEGAIANAVSTNPVCTSCHDQLDPIASFLFVFAPPEDDEYDAGYRPESGDSWEEATGKPPAYFGRPGESLTDLAQGFIGDPRYARCAVQRVYEGLLDRAVGPNDSAATREHLRAFENGGRTFKALYRSVMADPVYRGRTDGERDALGGKMLSPESLQRVTTDLTGYQAKVEGQDLLRLEDGLRVLGGGLSAASGEHPTRTANVTRALVQARLAEAAAIYAVGQDGEVGARLFGDERSADTLSEPAVERLFQRVLNRRPSDEETADLQALFSGLVDDGADSEVARAGVLSVLLRDREFVVY